MSLLRSNPNTPSTYARVVEGPLSFLDPRVGGVADGAATTPTDNAAAVARAWALLPAGGTLYVPKGVYGFLTAPPAQPGGVWIEGEGYDYATPADSTRPARGSVFRARAAMTQLWQLSDQISLAAGKTGASAQKMTFDGNNLAATTLKLAGTRHRVSHVQVYSAITQAVWMACQNGHLQDCIIAQDNTGDVVLVQGSGVLDNKIWSSQVRSPGPTGAAVRIVDAPAVDVQDCHLWAGGGGVPATAQALIALIATNGGGITNTMIGDNTIEGVLGPEVYLEATGSGVITATGIQGNKFYNNSGTADATYPVLALAKGSLSGIAVVGNVVGGFSGSSRYKSLIDIAAAVTASTGLVVAGNVARYVAALMSGSAPTSPVEYAANQLFDGASWKRTSNRGVQTATGDGTTVSFSWAHGLAAAPASVTVTPGSPAAAAASYVTWDATNVTVTFTTAPANAATLRLNWAAEL